MTILSIQEASFLKAIKHTNSQDAHAVIDTILDTHLNCMCQRDAYAHTHSQMLCSAKRPKTRQDKTRRKKHAGLS